MIYGSVCSGIEAATQAWHPLGWKPSFFSEIEKFPRDVLTHHYPQVPLHGDFTTIQKDDYEPIELLVGGTPCQSFSVAGLRAGLDDPRGNLMLEFGALAKRLQPKWLVWENVPGVLSSNSGRDFGSFLAMLAELGYGFSYRVLDAQFVRTDGHPYAVPQIRRRVFVIGCFGSWQCAAAVLFDRESLQGNPPPRRSKGQKTTSFTASSFGQYDVSPCQTKTDVIAFYENHPADSRVTDMGEVCTTVTSRWGTGGGNVPYAQMQMQVRRLTPTECARLQGFPDNYLSQVKGANDSNMYKALGNSMAVNVMQLIGERINLVEQLQADLAKKEAA
ncbi:MAG: hypothetical protein CTY37_08585 [Methylotenera sp.]|nr:MAG: hypothetical protein CTY37_08585 [Methylotenera sp.]